MERGWRLALQASAERTDLRDSSSPLCLSQALLVASPGQVFILLGGKTNKVLIICMFKLVYLVVVTCPVISKGLSMQMSLQLAFVFDVVTGKDRQLCCVLNFLTVHGQRVTPTLMMERYFYLL